MEGIEDCSDEAKLMKLITRAFGTGFNSEGFKMLGASLDWLEFQSLTIRQKELLLLGKSTLLQPIQADDMEDLTWKRKGTRPGSFPDKRLKQLNELLSSFQMQRLMDLLNDGFALKELRRFFKIIIGKNGKQLLSPWMTDQLIINAIIPFLWQTQKAKQRFVAMRILEEMKPENNKYTRMWKHWGLEAENAFDSQGLNALFKDKCARKKCLSCSVGKKLMYDQ